MTVRVLRAADRRAVPWKNGGGVTREIAVSPEGAGTDDFDWRISLADVGADGPFSALPRRGPDPDRRRGRGDGPHGRRTAHTGRRASTGPYRFPGDVETDGRLVDGRPVVNFNVMHRRGRTAMPDLGGARRTAGRGSPPLGGADLRRRRCSCT